jgi:cytochrome b involved in lipid metabolism
MLKTKSYIKYKSFTDSDIKKSKSLIIINNNVYDISINNWINNHPGGDIIKKYIGKDATKIFKYIHPKYANHLLEQLFVGVKV